MNKILIKLTEKEWIRICSILLVHGENETSAKIMTQLADENE